MSLSIGRDTLEAALKILFSRAAPLNECGSNKDVDTNLNLQDIFLKAINESSVPALQLYVKDDRILVFPIKGHPISTMPSNPNGYYLVFRTSRNKAMKPLFECASTTFNVVL